MPAPQQASVVASGGTVFWSDGITKFDGWALFILALPTGYTSVTNANQQPPQVLAQRFRCDILAGVPDSSLRVNYTTSLQPPGCKYAVWWFDGTDTLIYSPSLLSELFSVTSSPITLPAVTLTKPAAPASLPILGSAAATSPATPIAAPKQYSTVDGTLTGAVTGSNTTFGLPIVPNVADVYRAGLLQTQGAAADVQISNSAVVFTSGSIPTPGDIVTVIVRQ